MKRGSWMAAALVAAALVAGGGPAGATGTIQTTGATIAAGTAPAQGTVTIDPAAPGVAPADPTFGSAPTAPAMTGAMPAFAGAGTGSDGAYSASADTTLAGGTWNFTTFSVTNDAVVTVTGAATILVQGDASILGSVVTANALEPLTLRVGGAFTLHSSATTCRVETMGSGSDILIAAGEGLYVGDGTDSVLGLVRSMLGSVELRAHGTDGAGDALEVVSGQVLAPAGAVTLLSSASLLVGGTSATDPGDALAGGGALTVRAFGAGLTVAVEGEIDPADPFPAVLESAGRLDFDGYCYTGGASPMRVVAVAGPLEVAGSFSTYDGTLDALSGGAMTMASDDSEVTAYGDGAINFSIVGAFSMAGDDVRAYADGGGLTLAAGGDISLGQNCWLGAYSGSDLVVRSSGGAVTLEGNAEFASTGDIDVRGPDGVFLGADLGQVLIHADSILLAAGDGGIVLDAEEAYTTVGDFTLLATGPVVVSQAVTAKGSFSLASPDDDVDVVAAAITTETVSGAGSGSIVIESWNDAAVVDADGATVQSGSSDVSSGNVSLLVHSTGGGGPPAVVSFLLPKKVVAKLDGAKSRLTAVGFFDMGPDAVDLTAATTVTVGGQLFSFDGLTSDGKGLKFLHAEDGLQLLVMPNRFGSSRARFRLKASGASLVETVDPEGTLDLGFDNGQVDGTGTVRLAGGKYVLGRTRGALVTPNLYLAKGKAVLKGAGADSLKLLVGLATDGGTPEEAPDLEIGFGEVFTASIPGGSFERKGDSYRATVDGVTAVLDYRRETLRVSVRGASLGTFAAGPQSVSVTVTLGTESREVQVRMVRRKAALLY